MTRPGPLIVQIGFNKCGTRSLANLMQANGIAAADWRRGAIARLAHARQADNESPFADFPDTVWFSDMEDTHGLFRPMVEFYKQYDYIHRHHPDAYFVLNTRRKSDWLRSRERHKNYLLYYRRFYRTLSRAEVLRRWAEDWDRHHAAVQAYFADKPGRLMVYDIDRDRPEKLAAFLAPHYRLTRLEMPHRGDTDAKRRSRWWSRPGWLKRHRAG